MNIKVWIYLAFQIIPSIQFFECTDDLTNSFLGHLNTLMVSSNLNDLNISYMLMNSKFISTARTSPLNHNLYPQWLVDICTWLSERHLEYSISHPVSWPSSLDPHPLSSLPLPTGQERESGSEPPNHSTPKLAHVWQFYWREFGSLVFWQLLEKMYLHIV